MANHVLPLQVKASVAAQVSSCVAAPESNFVAAYSTVLLPSLSHILTNESSIFIYYVFLVTTKAMLPLQHMLLL